MNMDWNNINIVLSNSSFWTALSAVATAVMVVLTYFSIRNSKKQLTEMKAQWERENRPYLEILPVIPPFHKKEGSLALQIKNIGNRTATNIKLSIDQGFIDGIKNEIIKDQIKKICSHTYRVLPRDSKVITLCALRILPNGTETLFGEEISKSKIDEIKEYLSSFSCNVHCEYDGHSFDQTITSRELTYEKFNYLAFLEDIEWDLSGIKSQLENINMELINISTK